MSYPSYTPDNIDIPLDPTLRDEAMLERIREIVMANPNDFVMDTWHCGTAHCIAGWAQVLSGRIGDHPRAVARELIPQVPEAMFTEEWNVAYYWLEHRLWTDPNGYEQADAAIWGE